MARRTGHYRTSRVSKFSELAAAGVSANGKLLYFYLALGPFSSFAGIGRVSMDSIAHDTGLSRAEIESALAELEKRPTPDQSFIVYDREHAIVWVRDYLRDDPAREKDPEILNETHRKGIENTLGDLPKGSGAVKKFRRYYKFTRHTPARGPAGGQEGPRGSYFLLPKTTNNILLPNPTARARARLRRRLRALWGRSAASDRRQPHGERDRTRAAPGRGGAAARDPPSPTRQRRHAA
jgi:hypothetical protein